MAAPLKSVAGLCVQALSSSCPLWLGSVLCPGLVLVLSSVAGLCVQALSSSCPLWLGCVSRPCPPFVFVWLGSVSRPSVSRPCPPLVLLLAAPLNSVAGLCVQALSSSCPLWLGSVAGPARFTGEACGRTNSDVNADKNSLMKPFALGVKVGRTKKSTLDKYWSKRIVLKLFGDAGIILDYMFIYCIIPFDICGLCWRNSFIGHFLSQSVTNAKAQSTDRVNMEHVSSRQFLTLPGPRFARC